MSHDKIKAAARQRMAETGEPYSAARRAVLKEQAAGDGERPGSDTKWFPISFSKSGPYRITLWLDPLFGGGPGRSGVEVDPDEIRVRMGDFKLDVPRSSVRAVGRSHARLRGTSGVHAGRGQLLVNGSADGLVELTIEPPCYTDRTLSTMFIKERVNSLIVSLVDPDGFITAVKRDGRYS